MHNDHPQRRTTLRVPRSKHRTNGPDRKSEPRQPRGHVATLKSWEGQMVGMISTDGNQLNAILIDADEFTVTAKADDGTVVMFKHALKAVLLSEQQPEQN